MWYYVKNQEKFGPVADSALNSLLNSGEICGNTQVWQPGQKSWKAFRDTQIYRRATTFESASFHKLQIATKIFRAVLLAYVIVMLSSIVINLKRIVYFDSVLKEGHSNAALMNCLGVEYYKISQMSLLVIFILFVLLAKTAFNWIVADVERTHQIDKGFRISPSFAGWSLLIPIINLIEPYKIVCETYKSAAYKGNMRLGIVATIFLWLWWFFNLFSLLVFVLGKFVLASSGGIESAKSIMLFEIYSATIFSFTCVLWIVLISRILFLHRRAYKLISKG